MKPETTPNPAELAAEEAQRKIHECIQKRKNFLLEAGAGAGKTHSLIVALNFLIENKGNELSRRKQQVACITYTTGAVEEIKSRTDKNPIVLASTLHSFFWTMIKDFQPFLRANLPSLSKWPERLEKVGGVGNKRIEYDLGYPSAHSDRISLSHKDVLPLAVMLMEHEKFRKLLSEKFPIIFIDEYQDTDTKVVDSIKKNFLDSNSGPLIGFFGDHWQKIYGDGCGRIEHSNLAIINKGANFRSVKTIVDALNQMRPDLKQVAKNPLSTGTIKIFHSNQWSGVRRAPERGGHWEGDLPEEAARQYFEKAKTELISEGWDFSKENTKILMLTHSALAREQGYSNLAKIFPSNDSFIKKEDHYIEFFVDTLEKVCLAYEEKRYGEMFSAIGKRTPSISSFGEKKSWSDDMNQLIALRSTGTIGEVLEHIKQKGRPRATEAVERKENDFFKWLNAPEREPSSSLERIQEMRNISYKEVISLSKFVNDKTPFSTKHSVKGSEFENVFIVMGRGWNQYNFNQYLEWAGNPATIPPKSRDMYEGNRNLFYVVCSRPMNRLAILFTQKLSEQAMGTIAKWFGPSNVKPL